ncbi:MAG: phosphoribosylformylglycinamidine synthase [Oscillospiraceae bacterium]|nr:phosphoribosylformylglycinamidine synthase [Oscillospiraceae bacterium]
MVYRVFVEKKKAHGFEARDLLAGLKSFLRIEGLERVRIVNRYDVENITPELFAEARRTVFSELQLDDVFDALPDAGADAVFAVEYLPGQFDQRADSAAQCIQIISRGERPTVRTAKCYMLFGSLSAEDVAAIKKYVINPVEAREAALEKPETLQAEYDLPQSVAVLEGFTSLADDDLESVIADYGLAMDSGDVAFCRDYFRSEGREPTITELRMIDTYWSDHCRHTTFNTIIDSVSFADPFLEKLWQEYLSARAALGRTKPICLMDIGTLAAKCLKRAGMLEKLDESEEINACTVKIDVTVDGEKQPWLLLFKNETHNHPTEIEPFGGAATCIGGAIRDPLSGRSYVYAAMRVTGAGDPLRPVEQTLAGKLPQRKIVTTAAAGYSSYGNQIGLATGIVDELYHPGYEAKRMEIGAVIAAAPEKNVVRSRPEAGDLVILLGGRTGRDGCGGATGSSKSHTASSLAECGAEVQKGNAPEERKLQRLFRNAEASRMIKRCNDFGAGGVSVAIGELAEGLDIDLNAVPKKYEGLDGTELAISESQERMAVVVEAADAPRFLQLAESENLEATVVARVTDSERLRMSWNGKTIVDVSRAFLDSNGAEKHITAAPAAPQDWRREVAGSFAENFRSMAGDLNVCSKRGLGERFDSTIGAGTVLMPFGGKNQLTPIQAMAHKISVEKGSTDDCSVMSWGYNPYITEKSPAHGAYLAVVESVCKLVAAGAEFSGVYLSFQEYFERLGRSAEAWGKPLAALLGAFRAQMALGVAAIGGKDSMSGSFENIHVPPTLVSFAVTTEKCENIVPNHFKSAGHTVCLVEPEYDAEGLPTAESLRAVFNRVTALLRSGRAVAAWTPTYGGVAEAIMKMCFGEGFGFEFAEDVDAETLFGYRYGAFVLEMAEGTEGRMLGRVSERQEFTCGGESVSLAEILDIYEGKLESVYACNIDQSAPVEEFTYSASRRPTPPTACARPRVLIPVFPGTNCEYDSAKAFAEAGAQPRVMVLNNLSAEGVARSVDEFAEALRSAQMVFIPGGFSGGDEPDGSGKFITAFFRSAAVRERVTELLDERGGLMCGICNGFQALVKLGLVPYGKIIDADESCPTLTYNAIARHQSRIVRVRVASNKSPWLAATEPGEIYSVPISHGEGRFIAPEGLIKQFAENGQIATQYVDLCGRATDDVRFNPNCSMFAVEGITSPDGRVFGRMGHAERKGSGLYKNVAGSYDMQMFTSAVRYFK